MRRSRSFSLVSATAAVVAAVVAFCGALASPAYAETKVQLVQLNLCHSGYANCYNPDVSSLDWAAGVVAAQERPVVVTVNEVCEDDLPVLADKLGAADHRFVAAQEDASEPLDNPLLCKNGKPYGSGLLTMTEKLSWEESGVYADQDSGAEKRVWLCAGGATFGTCVTHLTHKDGAIAMKQCHALLDGPMAEHAAKQPMLLGGDFNLRYKGDPNVQDCVPSGMTRKGDGDVQHVFSSGQFTFDDASNVDHDGSTDHPGLIAHLTAPW